MKIKIVTAMTFVLLKCSKITDLGIIGDSRKLA